MEKGKRGRKMADKTAGAGKRMITAVLAVILAIYTCMALGGCRKTEEVPETSQEETGDRLQIGLSFESYVIERWIRERDVFVSAAKELGADVNVQNANGDVQEQIAQIEYFIRKQMDVIAVVAYGRILPQAVLDIPSRGCINIHASLLPALRGSGPVQWAVLRGLEETGVTAMYMAAEMDAGDMIATRRTPIDPNENAQSLLDRLAKLGAELLAETLTRLAQGPVAATPQDHTKATFAPMLTKDLCPIDWSRTPREIWNHIRGLDPWPVATMELQGKRFRVYKAVPLAKTTNRTPGTPLAVTRTGLEMACGEGGVLEIQVLQADGGKRMAAPDYFRGHPLAL